MPKISIDPITRLEGHGRIDIFVDDEGEVEQTYLVIPELRGFESFAVGRPVEEMPRITSRICGVCSDAHHLAAAKACDAVYHVDPPPTAKLLRELLYSAFYVADHATHFYILAAPDFVVGPTAPPAERNILGAIAKIGLEAGKQVIQARMTGHEIIKMLGGKTVHMVSSLPGGVSKGLNAEEQQQIIDMAEQLLEFGKLTIQILNDAVLANEEYVDLILSDAFTHETYYMGLVDENRQTNFYDGRVRVVDPEGAEFALYEPAEYLDNVAEHVEPWSYLKFPFLKNVGWKGFEDGKDSGVYRATPLSRINCSDGLATPLAQEEYERFYETLTGDATGRTPVHFTLATHWARVIELVYAAERTLELARDERITDPDIRTVPTETPDEGVGIVEAPRGTLTHHYTTDERGILTSANLIVGTTNNYAPISLSLRKAAKHLLGKGREVTEGALNMIEMAFRAYDPCFGCATHALLGEMPLTAVIRDRDGQTIRTVCRDANGIHDEVVER